MLKNLIPLTLIISFLSCKSKELKNEPKNKPVKKEVFAPADSMAVEDNAKTDSIQEDPNFQNYPLSFDDSALAKYPATILTTGEFHEDEVSREDAGRNWYGIFQNRNGYYVDSTRILTKRVQDPVDDEGTLNGWEVKTTNRDTSLLLFAGVSGLGKRAIKEVNLRKKEILPGESVTYTYNDITYTLYATGNKYKEKPGSDYYIVKNYRLFIKATINGSERTQLLVACGGFDDAMVEIIFTGDIDGDNIPDLVINTSYHYNAIVPTLYLSKPADSNEVFKLMGWHVSVDC
jgi:hypothetical protein